MASSNDSILYDQTKLTFLPNENRPNISFPPLGILPTNNAHKIIGTQAMFGNRLGEGDVQADEVTPAQITTMEVDDDLLATNEANIQAQTRATDVNVMSEEMTNGNYALKMQTIKSNKDRAMYVVQMLLRDAVRSGRLDQTMLANEEVVRICQVMLSVVEILFSKTSAYFDEYGFDNQLDLINVESIEDSESPYFTLVHNRIPTTTLFQVTRNIFNFKMEAVTENMYRNGVDINNPLNVFKQFFYYLARENGLSNVDNILVFRSEKRFRQSTIIRYQSLEPQMRTRNFFYLLDNYLLQLHVSGSTDSTDNTIFNNIVETDLNRRFNAVIFNFMAGVNATMEGFARTLPTCAVVHGERQQVVDISVDVLQAGPQ